MRPSAYSVSASVVHAVADWLRNNGPPLTRRGAGKPARRRADQAASLVAETDDRAVLDLDPRLQLVRLAEAVSVPEAPQIAVLEPIRRRVVVVADPRLERQLGHPLDCLGRNPRDRGD